MVRCLGSTMGELKKAIVHVYRKTGGVYLREKVVLNITPPLPISVIALHEDRNLSYGKHILACEKGPCVDEHTQQSR
ncbi:unnamed protein product [Linum trigynum]|uniref:Uncharacterized protein n=1 Tax=Linum trigynum TaxID=586398 RepID=A0AAV2EB50_9ROSI